MITLLMDGVLNEVTGTIHRSEPGTAEPRATCGVTYHLDVGRLSEMSVERATADHDARKCGRCFEDGHGY